MGWIKDLFGRPEPAATRSTEASLDQLVTSGAAGGQFAVDPIDGDVGFRQIGAGSRETPQWTLEKQRAYSVAAYRLNPMARAIIDTYTSFVVGDSGLTIQCGNADVMRVVQKFWNDPRNNLNGIQELLLRDHMLMGETALEMMVGPLTGVTRFSPIATTRVVSVGLQDGNPLWPSKLVISTPAADDRTLDVACIDDMTELRGGNVQWWPSWKTTLEDRRGQPFLGPILDWLDDYDDVLSNLIDRTALARYLTWDVTLEGATQTEIDAWVKSRGGTHIPRSGTIEAHNEKVIWKPQSAQSGAQEDSGAAKDILTSIASGAGLAKHWLADPDNANRATSLSMAEPVLRRVSGVQNVWLAYQTELARYAVDQAVRAGRLPAMVEATDAKSGPAGDDKVTPSETVKITGPEIAVAEASATATTLLKLAQGIDVMLANGTLSVPAGKILAQKAWEQYAGVPYTSELDGPDVNVDDITQAVDDAQQAAADSAKARVANGTATVRKLIVSSPYADPANTDQQGA
ncbi:MAG TPA: hypothetical protein VGH54_10670 [Mycobacterium sp.]|jgi:hypothetical protein|uniref:hypothetical protein n=1 Tax=Mycobacterium sp. TaxID=1785 RepID=UPI002F3EBF39